MPAVILSRAILIVLNLHSETSALQLYSFLYLTILKTQCALKYFLAGMKLFSLNLPSSCVLHIRLSAGHESLCLVTVSLETTLVCVEPTVDWYVQVRLSI